MPDAGLRRLAPIGLVALLAAACSSGGSSDGDAACRPTACQGGAVLRCGDCLDNDGDGATDAEDPECLGPCDDTEDSYHPALPGVAGAACAVDCYFDGDAGSGDDGCRWSHVCDPLEVAPDYAPEGSACAYRPDATISGSLTCGEAMAAQSAQCLDACLPRTPSGCDCFGCCEIPGAPTPVWLGSVDALGQGSCSQATLADPAKCKPCTQVTACLNACERCALCAGKTTLPADCGGLQTCPAGAARCGLPGQGPCAEGTICISGCCRPDV